jgi:hypothetical protein
MLQGELAWHTVHLWHQHLSGVTLYQRGIRVGGHGTVIIASLKRMDAPSCPACFYSLLVEIKEATHYFCEN